MKSEILPRGRRIKNFKIHPTFFPGAFRDGTFMEIVSGIPDGAMFCGYAIDPATNSLSVFVEHESFELIPENGEVPMQSIVTQTYYGDELKVFKRFIAEALHVARIWP